MPVRRLTADVCSLGCAGGSVSPLRASILVGFHGLSSRLGRADLAAAGPDEVRARAVAAPNPAGLSVSAARTPTGQPSGRRPLRGRRRSASSLPDREKQFSRPCCCCCVARIQNNNNNNRVDGQFLVPLIWLACLTVLFAWPAPFGFLSAARLGRTQSFAAEQIKAPRMFALLGPLV